MADGPPDVEFVVLGGPEEGPTLRLDHERFAYAGKFVLPSTGKAVARERVERTGEGDAIAAAAFDRDRTDGSIARIRYLTVRGDRRGEGVGSRLLAFVAGRLLGEFDAPPVIDGVREVRISVNNPFAFEAAYKAGFGSTGERTGLSEVVLARPGDRSTAAYRRGLSFFDDRDDLDGAERAFLDDRLGAPPPRPLRSPVDQA